ncbi:S41 family peptidase [Roseivirga sp. BDSF3-8]|uniref:S41 family peptidase n=1 Tax=Roseivirga sp. BDSF3-8 TaxID=3241598 RepID=UPI003531E465
MESNFPGFDKDVTMDNREDYLSFKDLLAEKAVGANSANECLRYLTYYVEFFEDNHTKMQTEPGERIDESSAESINHFLSSEEFLQTEMVALSSKQKVKGYAVDDIRGVYVSSDDTYTVALIESRTDFRDYVAVIVDSKTRLWKKGQVKFEIKRKKGNIYEGFFYNRYHQATYETSVAFDDGFLGNWWIKESKSNKTNHSLNFDQEFYYSVMDSAVILRIPSFMEQYTHTIDSLYTAAKPAIEAHRYLLIDVRNNGGGNSSNFSDLIPYLYTKPIIDTETVEFYATEDNIRLYAEAFDLIMQDSAQVNAETIEAFREAIDKMEGAEPNSFVGEGVADTLVLSAKPLPQKVGIIYNRGCASACEDLLFIAKHSDKTLLLGDNSGGFVGYGNVFTTYTPCYGFGLSCSTTRYRTQWAYEVIGIAPDIRLDYDYEWLGQALTILKND